MKFAARVLFDSLSLQTARGSVVLKAVGSLKLLLLIMRSTSLHR